jgi:hypothetical protein
MSFQVWPARHQDVLHWQQPPHTPVAAHCPRPSWLDLPGWGSQQMHGPGEGRGEVRHDMTVKQLAHVVRSFNQTRRLPPIQPLTLPCV